MSTIIRSVVAFVLAVGLASPVFAQQWGQPQGGMQPQGGPSLVGTWSWQSPGQGGMDFNTVAFQPDGSFLRVSRLANGTFLRVWGRYNAASASPTQVNLQTQLAGWLPQQICNQATRQCAPFQYPQEPPMQLNFLSASTIQVAGSTINRDPNPYLLQQQVPAQLFVSAPAAPAGLSPNPSPILPTPTPRPMPGVNSCDDLQQQRICSINNGHLITSGGCMKCVTD